MVVLHALAEVYVATGDPILGSTSGMLERWPIVARDVYLPTMGQYGNEWAERYGLFEGCQQAKGNSRQLRGIWEDSSSSRGLWATPMSGCYVVRSPPWCSTGAASIPTSSGTWPGRDGFAFELKAGGPGARRRQRGRR